jgi:hypothetical protein
VNWSLADLLVAKGARVLRNKRLRRPVFCAWGISVLVVLAGCRNKDSCCGLEVGEVYDIEFLTEIEVDQPELFACPELELQSAGSVGDTLRVEVERLKYDEQLDCSDVVSVRLLAATPDRFQFLVGKELENGSFFGLDGRYRRILGGDVDAPAGETGFWRMGLQAGSCEDLDSEFNAERPDLIFGVFRNTTYRDCAEAWGVRVTRVDDEE